MSWSSALTRLNDAVRDTFSVTATWTHGSIATDISIVTSQSRKDEEALPPNYIICWLLLSDAPTIARGDTLLISTSYYRVIDVDTDGGGGANITAENYTP